MAGASHGGMPLDRNTWQTGTQEGMDSVDRYNMGLARPGANIANLVEMLNSDYVAYVAAYNAEHEI